MELFKFKGTLIDRAADRVCSCKTYRLTMERSSAFSDDEQARYRSSQIQLAMGQATAAWMSEIEARGRPPDEFVFFLEPSCVLQMDVFDVQLANSCY